ncbi:hypothetical protein D6779_10665, partial [Candidatus Parcubacteria bacterium]
MMSEVKTIPWIAVNEMMTDEYRKTVCEIALEHLPHASKELRIFAKNAISNAVFIKGFRSPLKAPGKVLLKAVIDAFQTKRMVATAIISLWAEAQEALLQELRDSALKVGGFQFDEQCTWRRASQGFVVSEATEKLQEFCARYAEERKSPETDHIILGGYWLSSALIVGDAKESVPEEIDQPREDASLIDLILETENPMDENLEPLAAVKNQIAIELSKYEAAHQNLIESVELLLRISRDEAIDQSVQQLDVVKERLASWEKVSSSLRQKVQDGHKRVLQERARRPDMQDNQPLGQLFDDDGKLQMKLSEASRVIVEAIEEVLDYDLQKENVTRQIEQLLAEVSDVQHEIKKWAEGEDVKTVDVGGVYEPEREITLKEAQSTLEHLKSVKTQLEQQERQLRQLSEKRIIQMATRLQEEFDTSADFQLEQISLKQLTPSLLANMQRAAIRSLEAKLDELLNAKIEDASKVAPITTAQGLKANWQRGELPSLLEQLVASGREVPACLLLLAANRAYPAQTKLEFSREVVQGLLRGLGSFSERARPFDFVSAVAPDFFNGWEPVDNQSWAEVCLILLAAQYGAQYPLPEDFLWSVTIEWPLEDMPQWKQLWQGVLVGEPLPIVKEGDKTEWMNTLDEARKAAEDVLAHEHGHFIRLGSLKSRRHVELLAEDIMPEFLKTFNRARELEDSLRKANQDEKAKYLQQLEALTSETRLALSRDNVQDKYERGVSLRDIKEDAFHRRSALRVVTECAEKIASYVDSLQKTYSNPDFDSPYLIWEELEKELEHIPDMTTMGMVARDQVFDVLYQDRPSRDEEVANTYVEQRITSELLTQSRHIMNMPRVITYLNRNHLDWPTLLKLLLEDLGNPLDENATIDYLLEKNAVNQVLLLSNRISLEIQTTAQQKRRKMEKELEALFSEYLQSGGSIEQWQLDRELGRWHLITQTISEQLQREQEKRKQAQETQHKRARELRQRINALDSDVFDAKEEIPSDIYQLIEDGLNHARQCSKAPDLLEHGERYVQEIRYRLAHKSWPLSEMRKANEQLIKALGQKTERADKTLTVEQVFDLLNRGELQSLGLDSHKISPSSVNTRMAFLRNWLEVKQIRAFWSKEMKVAERNAIQALFRYFAQMVSLKIHKGADGKPMEYDEPIVYSWWDLQYPKTAALDKPCILISLPGSKPSPSMLRDFQELLDNKEWLELFFVILFIPGCTQQVRQRLSSHYAKKGLVIIDEEAVIKMTLAESGGHNPIGRLRPMMLNALGAEDVDIFTVNQLVDSRSSIFVGRNNWVEKISSSGDNYAIYGGRRIGKSSVLRAVEHRLRGRGIRVVSHSFEGKKDCSDDASAIDLATLIGIKEEVAGVDDFKRAMRQYLEKNTEDTLVLLLDEIDYYIASNQNRHVLIEALRFLSDQFQGRFRVIVAGFMLLYDCLRGRSPYTPSSDPWRRMFKDDGPLPNLKAARAEEIVIEGFENILDWQFESRVIPQRVVQYTG